MAQEPTTQDASTSKGGGRRVSASGDLEVSTYLEIARERAAQLDEIRRALLDGDDQRALSLMRLYTGIDEEPDHEEGQRPCRPGDGDAAFLQRLANGFQDGSAKFGELIEKEQAVMGQRQLARFGHGAAAHQ